MTTYDLEELELSKGTCKIILWSWFIIVIVGGVMVIKYQMI